MALSTLLLLCSHPHHLPPELSHLPKLMLCSHGLPQPLGPTIYMFCLYKSDSYRNLLLVESQYLHFCVCCCFILGFLLTIMSLIFIHVVTGVRISLKNIFHCMDSPHLFTPACVDRHGWFPPFGNCERCCYEYECASICSSI